MSGTWDVKKKRVKGNHEIWGPNHRSMELPFIEIWKIRGKQSSGGKLSSILDVSNLSCCVTLK